MAVIKRRSPDVWVALLLNCLLLATSFVDGRSHNNLRHDSNSNHQDHRELQRLAAGVINALISVVTPTISRAVQNQVKLHYDQADFYTEASPIDLGQVDLSAERKNETSTTNCERRVAQIMVQVDSVQGLGNIVFESLEYVEGSQELEVSFTNILQPWWREASGTAVNWEGQWRANTTFDNVTVATSTTVSTASTSCNNGEDTQETIILPGTMTFQGVSSEAFVTVRGATDRMVSFGTTTQVTEAIFDALQMTYQSLQTNLGSFPTDSSFTDNADDDAMISVDYMFQDLIQKDGDDGLDIADYMGQLIYVVQNITNNLLPAKLVP